MKWFLQGELRVGKEKIRLLNMKISIGIPITLE